MKKRSLTRQVPVIAFVGPMPPPIHGMATVSEQIVRRLQDRCGVDVLTVQASGLTRTLGSHFGKTRRAIRALLGLIAAKIRGVTLLYLAADDGLGGLWTATFGLLARLLRLDVYLHHHSYRYIRCRSLIMSCMVYLLGPNACHVVLCERMARDFKERYPMARRFFIAPNSVEPAPAEGMREPARPGPITIGLLSNLTPEKGVFLFVDILSSLRERGYDVRGRLAGPAVGVEMEASLQSKCLASGGTLQWSGPVHDAAKEEFFAAIDLFVFPTRGESFGLVLLEALIRGVPIIAPLRGCICEFSKLDAAEIVPESESFADRTEAMIERITADSNLRTRLSTLAASQGSLLNEAHRAAQEALVCEMTEAATRIAQKR